MAIFDSLDLALPIISVTENRDGTRSTLKHIFGTCFSIGNGYFLTAGHVGQELIETASKIDQFISLRTHEEGNLTTLLIGNVEILNNDVALIKLNNPSLIHNSKVKPFLTTLHWTARLIQPLDTVQTHGYAYGEVLPETSGKPYPGMLQRSFRGHIVSSLINYKPLWYEGDPFPVVELSFNIPRGLSGAPLIFISSDDVSYLAGVVLGTSQTSMIILDKLEITDDGKTRTAHTIEERLSLGIAARNDGIFALHSDLLKSTIGEHLYQLRLLLP